ncbi:MAG: 4Fe-4S binding protein [Desulfovibrionales bacterium]
MILSVASGKGGTGKTTVAASLAAVWESPVVAVDLDVEEPNLHLFLNPKITSRRTASMEIPVADETKCTFCRACAEICQFKAISVFGEVLLTFPEMCHGCGGCIAVCPEKALSPGSRSLGEVSQGYAGEIPFLMGKLRVGEAMSPPLMRAVKQDLGTLLSKQHRDVIVDAPPGVSCPAVSAVMDSDVIVLVTEPTPFGLYDFRLAYEAFSPMGKPLGAVVNRAGLGDPAVYEFCDKHNIPVLAEIPFERRIAEAYSRGTVLATVDADLTSLFVKLRDSIRDLFAGSETQETSHA